MKNILLVSHDFSVTGAPNSLLRQAKYLKKAGFNVDIWALGGGDLYDRYIEEGLHPIVLENTRRAIYRQYKKRNYKYDLIICNTTVTYKAVDVLQRYGVPVIWFIRETKLVEDGIRADADFANVFKNFYNIYTVSDYAAKVSKKYNKNVRIINNAVEDNFVKYSPIHKSITFGYIGSISYIKGVEILIKAFNDVYKKNPNIKLLIAGHYWNEYGLRLFAQKHKAIKWLGEIQCEAKQRFFNSIDCLCVPSFDEPSGLTVIEGAMYGKPMIVSENIGASYIIKNKESGFVVKTNNVKALAGAMQKICVSDIKNMQKNARSLYLKYGTTDREEQEVLKMVEDNLGNKPVVKNKMKLESTGLPNWFVRFVCCLIPIRSYRHKFRDKVMKLN